MAVNEIRLEGWKEFEGKLDRLPPELLTEFDEVAGFAAAEWEGLAKVAAPVDFGFLKRGISHFQVAQGNWDVISSVYYSPYQEWGTITRVFVPAALTDYAIQFKGRGIRKTGGVFPHPFFFPQKPVVEKQLIADLQQIVKTPR